MSIVDRRSFAVAAAAGVLAATLPASPVLARGGLAPEFTGIDGWLNSGPLTMQSLRGRPVLINFWARQCSNCRAAMPAIKGWYAKYRDRGFVVVGVHTPEFDIEKSRPALEAAAARFGLAYPIAQDNASATWNAYGNRYWPAEYLIDQSGKIVFTHYGEGAYDEIDRRIGALLSKA